MWEMFDGAVYAGRPARSEKTVYFANRMIRFSRKAAIAMELEQGDHISAYYNKQTGIARLRKDPEGVLRVSVGRKNLSTTICGVALMQFLYDRGAPPLDKKHFLLTVIHDGDLTYGEFNPFEEWKP